MIQIEKILDILKDKKCDFIEYLYDNEYSMVVSNKVFLEEIEKLNKKSVYTVKDYNDELWYLDYITESFNCNMEVLHLKKLTNDFFIEEFNSIN